MKLSHITTSPREPRRAPASPRKTRNKPNRHFLASVVEHEKQEQEQEQVSPAFALTASSINSEQQQDYLKPRAQASRPRTVRAPEAKTASEAPDTRGRERESKTRRTMTRSKNYVPITLFAAAATTSIALISALHLLELATTQAKAQTVSSSSTASAFLNNNKQLSQQMQLQVFNGNNSQQLEANHFKILKLDDEGTLLVGARNVVYNLSLTTLHEQRRLEWAPDRDVVELCRVKGKSPEQCQNYIRVIERPSADTLLVCGTNAYKPRCRQYSIGPHAYELTAEMPGEGSCPYQETQNVTSVFADGNLYSATAGHFNGIDGLIHRQPLRTEQYNPKQLNSPNFVSSFRYGEHVYFLFREIAIEHLNCGKVIYSRIARVCANDAGGATTRNRERWTSFTKARINCSIPGEFPFAFDEIQATSQVVRSSAYRWPAPSTGGSGHGIKQPHSEDLMYAVFTTPTNSIGGSAVCAYRMSDVLAAFDGPFKSQADSNSNWLPVPESRVPQNPRPGTCVNDSKRLAEEHINFIRDNPLMDQTVQPIWSQPLITMASINFRFTTLTVDPQVETQQAFGAIADTPMRTDVIFAATDDGRIFKLVNTFHLAATLGQQRTIGQPAAMALQTGGPLPTGPASGHHPFLLSRPMAQVYAGNDRSFPIERADVSASTIVIEELHLFDSRTPITSLVLARPPTSGGGGGGGPLVRQPSTNKLIVMSSKQIKAIPTSRCERAQTCLDCLSLLDPYCAWDLLQGACLPLGRSTVIQPPPALSLDPLALSSNPDDNLLHGFERRSTIFPPNMSPIAGAQANNHTLGWWASPASCPSLTANGEPIQQQVGAPYRSLFSSHLQVPSRFDYQSGHHLSRPAGLLFPPAAAAATSPVSTSVMSPRQPVSECLTFCGAGYQATASLAADASGQQQQQQLLQCADYFASSMGAPPGNTPLWQQQQQQHLLNQNFYTSENLYLAVIICALLGLVLGLLFGFAIGKNTRGKNESSICSSTFDETNLYMASTGSHGGCQPGSGGGGLFAPLAACHPSNSTVARLTSHPAYLAAQAAAAAANGQSGNNYATLASQNYQQQQRHNQLPNGGHHQRQHSGGMGAFEASQSLLAAAAAAAASSDHSSGIGSSTYGNQPQSQLLFHAAQPPQQQQHERSPSVRTGALPPIPTSGGQKQQPLVAGGPSQTIHLHHNGNGSQLTPNSQSSSTGSGASQPPTTATSSSSAGSSITSQSTLQVGDHHHQQQLYLNQQQLNGTGPANLNLHQRSFTNSSSGSGKGAAASGAQQTGKPGSNSSTFLAQHQQQQQANNNIFL